MSICEQYKWIIKKEIELRTFKTGRPINRDLSIEPPPQIIRTTRRILEIAKNSTVLRCGNHIGHLTTDSIAYESDGAHTNLVRSLVKYGLICYYNWGNYVPAYNLNDILNDIDEAATLHDLPENETGDIPDNRSRNEEQKIEQENAYYGRTLGTYPSIQYHSTKKIASLLREMQDKSTIEGRALYLSDKLAAIIMMLTYESYGIYPAVFEFEESIGRVDKAEINLCHRLANGSILLSELWTVDFLYGRELVNYDDGGFYTAILVMATLLIHHDWYEWRERQYL